MDVNIIIYAHRPELPQHAKCLTWLEETVNRAERFGVSEFVLASFVRIITNAKAFSKPSSLDLAIRVANELLARPNCQRVRPGTAHWSIFTSLCRSVAAAGNMITDAYLAALAIEHDCEWISTDSDFASFPGLRWRNPLE